MEMEFSFLRRRLLMAGVVLPATGSIVACGQKDSNSPQASRLYFTAKERRFIEAATARLIPDGEDGTGAIAAAVPFFIDRQLAGPYGRADTWYMDPPWSEDPTPEQGYQLAYTPAALYRAAIADIDAYCDQTFQSVFAELPPERQDDVLHQLEDGKIELEHIPAKAFFVQLWDNTLEGFLADPMYGGNRNFIGWKLIGFPGPRYNYVHEVTQYGQVYTLPPVGLLGRDGTRVLKG